MTSVGEKLQNRLMAVCLRNIEDAILVLAQELSITGVSFKSFDVDYWPTLDNRKVRFKIWDGDDFIYSPISKISSTNLKTECVLAIARRRQILKRKY